MFSNEYVSKYEVDTRCFIYHNSKIVDFSEIEEEIRKRTKRLHIIVYGEYSIKYNIDPYVYLQVSFEGLNHRILLDKSVFNKENVSSYYDYLANAIVSQFAHNYFGDTSENKGE